MINYNQSTINELYAKTTEHLNSNSIEANQTVGIIAEKVTHARSSVDNPHF